MSVYGGMVMACVGGHWVELFLLQEHRFYRRSLVESEGLEYFQRRYLVPTGRSPVIPLGYRLYRETRIPSTICHPSLSMKQLAVVEVKLVLVFGELWSQSAHSLVGSG